MRFLLVGDLQMKRENLKLSECLFELIENEAKQRKLSEVFWLGDLLDRRGLIEAECLNSLHKYFSNSNFTHHVLVGNHDLINLHSKEHSLKSLGSIKNVILYDSFNSSLQDILVMPYTKNPQHFLKCVKESSAKYLICHQGVKEFTFGSGYTEDEAVGLDDLKQFKLVIAGHYHTPKEMENVVYLGSPFSHSFSESNESKRLGVFDTESGNIEYIPTNFRRHMTYNVCLENPEPVKYNLEDINRIIVKGKDRDIETFKKSKMQAGIKYVFISTDEKAVSIPETLTNKQKWVKWAKDIKQLDDSYVTAGLELLND